MISCLSWVPRGRMERFPTKIEYSAEEMEQYQLHLQQEKEQAESENGMKKEKETAMYEDDDMDMSEDDDSDDGDNDDNDVELDVEGEVGEQVIPQKSKKQTMEEKLIEDALLNELKMDDYDAEEDPVDEMENGELLLGGSRLTVFQSNAEDPYITIPDDDDASDVDDDEIMPTDAVLAVGRTEEEHSSVEIYVYDEDSANLYVHHDFPIPSLPLSLAWIDFDPRANQEKKTGSFLAIGSFVPAIEIWNLNVLDVLEPVAVLGGFSEDQPASVRSNKKGRRIQPKLKEGSHTDAVLCLGWHEAHRERLASGSADETVKLWDLSTQQCVHTFEHHKRSNAPLKTIETKEERKARQKKKKAQEEEWDGDEDLTAGMNGHKVQSLHWHPTEASLLLTGAYDRTAQLVDVRVPNGSSRVYTLDSDVEQVRWHPGVQASVLSPSINAHFAAPLFAVCTESGMVSMFDARMDKPLFRLAAHDGTCSAISFSDTLPSVLATSGHDKTVKLWDLTFPSANTIQPVPVHSKDMKIGKIWAMNFESRLQSDGSRSVLIGAGGDKGKVAIWDIRSDCKEISQYFGNELRIVDSASNKHVKSSAEASIDSDKASDSENVKAPHPPSTSLRQNKAQKQKTAKKLQKRAQQ